MDSSNMTTIKIGTLVSLLVVAILSAFVPPLLSLTFYVISFVLRMCSVSGKGNKFIEKLSVGTEKFLGVLLAIMETFQGFAGGVLLSAGLIHLLPDAVEEFEGFFKTWGQIEDPNWAFLNDYPLPFLCCCLGVVILLFMENVILSAIPNAEHAGHGHDSHHECKHEHEHEHEVEGNAEETKAITNSDDFEQQYQSTDPEKINAESTQKLLKKRKHKHNHHEKSEQISELKDTKHHHHHENQLLKCIGMFFGPSNIEKTLLGLLFHLSLSVHCFLEGLGLGISTDSETIISIFVAIISHKFVEGFALGVYLNNVNYQELYPNYFKGIAHKSDDDEESDDEQNKESVKGEQDAVINYGGYGKSAAQPASKFKRVLFSLFAQKLSFVKQISTFAWVSFLLVTFCCSTPLGILIGTLIASEGSEDDQNPWVALSKGIVLALAAGTFLFIVLCEIMNPHGHSHGGGGEHDHGHSDDHHKKHKKMAGSLFLKCGLNVLLKSVKFGLFIFGFIAMSVIAIWT